MKPSEIYSLPTTHVKAWYDASDDMIDSVFNLRGSYDGMPYGYEEGDGSPFKVHEKLDLTLTSNEEWLYIEVLEFAGVPFAVTSRLSTEHSGTDHEAVVTDRVAFEKARTHVINAIFNNRSDDLFADPEADIEWDLHGAVVARFGDEVRLVRQSDVGYGSAAPAFDRAKMERDFASKLRPLALPPSEKGLRSELGRDLAFEILGDAVLRGRKTMVGEFVRDTRWFGGFYETDDIVYEIFADSYDLGKEAAHWPSAIKIGYLCHGRYYDVLDKLVKTGEIDFSDSSVVDLQTSFDLTPDETAEILRRVSKGHGDFLELAVETLMAREDIPEKFVGMDHQVFGVARVLSEDPEMIRFGLGPMQSLSYAKKYWDDYQAILEKRQAAEAAEEVDQDSPAPSV